MVKGKILFGDVFSALRCLEDNSISVALTSPPYWRQRDYGFKGQIGREKTPEEYIGRLIVIFRELRAKLKDDGVFFLNIGDKYKNRYGKSHLLQIPYRLAAHMIKDGWKLLDIIIWYKPNHMPSSVKDRFTNTYEPVLVFGKSDENIYTKKHPVLKIPLQQTKWKHTAVFPEKLVSSLLSRCNLKDGDYILDPFAGTGTTGAVVKKMKYQLYPKDLNVILIEKGKKFLDIITERTGIKEIKELKSSEYTWEPVNDKLAFSEDKPLIIIEDTHGETFIAKNSEEFSRIIMGMLSEEFQDFHREDAVYFFGVKNWKLSDLVLPGLLIDHGFILRNMIIIEDGSSWYPVFMLVKDTTRVNYKFYIDRIRKKPKTVLPEKWNQEDFIGLIVNDNLSKKPRKGEVVDIISTYSQDNFPKIVAVSWEDDNISLELCLNPRKDEFIMESLQFTCSHCGTRLIDTYDPLGDNICYNCRKEIYGKNSLPILKESKEIIEPIESVENGEYQVGENIKPQYQKRCKESKSKFAGMERMNWGASPGARKTIIGDTFSKMRLYRLDQPTIARYLNIYMKKNDLRIKDITQALPPEYKHTVGHWFRKDFGGSIPLPEDVTLLEEILKLDKEFARILKRSVLKLQTVKHSLKGKNPGDFLELEENKLKEYLTKTYMPPSYYIKK